MLTKKLKFSSAELQNFNWIFNSSPCFPLSAHKIRILTDPEQFYGSLLRQFQTAKHRIYIASLYVGTGQHEKKLLDAAKKNIHENTDLKFNVLVDFQRGTRGSQNSKTLLESFVLKDKERCRVAMYQTPKMSGWLGLALPNRYNEIVGLQHMKIYITDNRVTLSGANFSHDYFTNRQDRYIQIEDQDLSDFYADLIDEVSEFSRILEPGSGSTSLKFKSHGKTDTFVVNAADRINKLISHWTEKQLTTMQNLLDVSVIEDTLVFPLIQMGQLGVTQDEQITLSLMEAAPRSSKLRIATGYFNLTQNYALALLRKCEANVTLLMAHPTANGFLNASGIAGGIPDAYSLIAKRFLKKVVKEGQQDRITLYEYKRNGWTFHAKGLWYYPPGCLKPWMTLVGSANLGERSVQRDLEAQAAIFTTSPYLQELLHLECNNIHSHSQECSKELQKRRIPLWVHTTVKMFRQYF